MSRRTLAYVFWHRAAAGVDTAEYERRLTGFHAALAADPPRGFGGSCALRVGGEGYEDWYLVPDWAALGELNAHAVSGSRSAPHDAAAAAAGDGSAGIYAPVRGPAEAPVHPHGAWLAKPASLTYAEFHAALDAVLPAGATVWQRQMTLGPAGEYTVRSPGPLELSWPARVIAPVVVV
jgi:hypothetical protein